MLHLLFGRAGSGKTETTRRRLGQLAKAGRERLFLLVPEQASFVNERAILQLLGPRLAGKVQVLSFSRLCDALFRQYGGSAGRRLDDGGRAVFMSLAVESVKDTLQYYRRSAEGIELVHLLLDANAEFHSCGIGPEDLRTAAAQTEAPPCARNLRNWRKSWPPMRRWSRRTGSIRRRIWTVLRPHFSRTRFLQMP